MNQFTHVGLFVPGSNNFALNHSTRVSVDGGRLFPVLCEEVLPGDVWRYNNTTLTRLTPMVTPAMDDIDISYQAFFIPNRLIWPNWEKFMENPIPSETTPVHPYITGIPVQVGDLGDYMGLPTTEVYDDANGGVFQQYEELGDISALPFAAYQKVWHDWFQPVNIGTKLEFKPLTDGNNNADIANLYALRRRGWQHDYFTAASIAPQAGQPVVVPIGDSAPVVYDNPSGNPGFMRTGNNTNPPVTANDPLEVTWPGASPTSPIYSGSAGINLNYDPNGSLVADLSSAAGVDIETLRWSITLQQFLERNNLGGTRYIEQNLVHWGVKSSDARLQRSELIGSSTDAIVISEVLQNAPPTEAESTPQGNMAGHGLGFGKNHFRPYFAEEHGWILVVGCIRPKTSYSQGIARKFTRKVPLDYPFPEFAGLGEQSVKKRELYFSGNPVVDDADFGYQPRYSEYRFIPSKVAGEFRTTLAPWTMSRLFYASPNLNANFVSCNPTERIFAVMGDSSHSYLLKVNHRINVSRKLPKYGIPGVATV